LQVIDDYIIRHSIALITNSIENLEYLKKISSNPSLINGYVIKNGIDVLPKNILKKKREKHSITIGTVALFKEQKNYPLFIDLCKSITDEYSNVNFMAIGTGPEFDKIVSYSKSNKCDSKLKFMGNRIDSADIMLNKFDIFVLTSKREGLPNAIMEAMGSGIPVVATNVGGVSELVQHGETGFLVPSGDLDGLIKYCKMLINDPDLRAKMGRKGKDFITRNYSSEKMVREFEVLFESILKGEHTG
ncbi:MAG: glycosyltransferase, partial [Candidatus Cloacimonetes bacterium]|nr:glycosyltransferase [Candidatus Cloacimonadota bacterium]